MKKCLHVLTFFITTCLLLASCVSARRYHAAQADAQTLRDDSAKLAGEIASQSTTIGQLKQQIADLNKKVDDLNSQAGLLSSDAANKQKMLNMTKEQLEDQQKRLLALQGLMDQQKRAINDIRKKMSDALVGFNPKDLTVAIKNGKVYVSLSENLLFPSGSAVVNPKGKEALGKLARRNDRCSNRSYFRH